MSYHIPVAYFCCNRPEIIKRTWDKLRDLRPRYVYVFHDPPKNGGINDACYKQVKEIVQPYWPTVEYKYTTHIANIGTAKNVTRGVTQVLLQHQYAIVLEDDLLPSMSFFQFCEEMLVKYKDARNVMHVAGFQPLDIDAREADEYYFSKIPFVWGWATWSRAWQSFHNTSVLWTRGTYKGPKWPSVEVEHYLKAWFLKMQNWSRANVALPHHYDAVWMSSIFDLEGLSIMPKVNLVKNIGFGDHASATKDSADPLALLTAKDLKVPANRLVATSTVDYDKEFIKLMGPGWSVNEAMYV